MSYPSNKIILDKKDSGLIRTPAFGSAELFLDTNGLVSTKRDDGTVDNITSYLAGVGGGLHHAGSGGCR